MPGRDASDRIHIGIDWLGSIAFGHVDSIGERVLIIGVGNTAMDCCRSSLRLGAKDVKVIARKPRQFFKASDWELEDAEEERVEIVVNHSPKEFVLEDGKLVGMRFDELEYELDDAGEIVSTRVVARSVPAVRRRRARDRPGERFPVDRARLRRRVRPARRARRRSRDVPIDAAGRVLRRRRGVRPEEHHLGRRSTVMKRRSRFTSTAKARALTERLPRGVTLTTAKMGIHEWSYSNGYEPAARRIMPHVDLKKRFKKLEHRGGARLQRRASRDGGRALLELRPADGVHGRLCIECDACIDICPVDCLAITPNGSEAELSSRLKAARLDRDQQLFVSAPLKQTARVMLKDENLCVHCGLCAERCPTGAWDMQKSTVTIPYARDEARRAEAEWQSSRKAG